MNVLLLCVGAVALYDYLQTHEPTNLQLVAVAAGVLIFGILLPAFAMSQVMKRLEKLRKQTEKIVAEYVSQWIASLKEFDDEEPLHNPKFWLNMVLLLMEVLGDHSRHPGLQALAEFAPILRTELRKASRVGTVKK